MPQRRQKRRHNRKRMHHKKKGPSTKTLAKRIHKISKMIELKYFDINIPATNVVNTGVLFNPCPLIVQGNTQVTRVGDQITPTSFQFKLDLNSVATTTVANTIRIILFWDRQANGVVATLSDALNFGLLDNTVVTNLVYCPRNYLCIDKYHVIYDKTFILNPQTGVAAAYLPVRKHVQHVQRLSRTVKYVTDTGTITDMASNNFYMAVIGDVAAQIPNMIGGLRFYYKDA